MNENHFIPLFFSTCADESATFVLCLAGWIRECVIVSLQMQIYRQPWAFPEAAHKENIAGVFLEGTQSDTKRELTACFDWIDSTFSEAAGRQTSTAY